MKRSGGLGTDTTTRKKSTPLVFNVSSQQQHLTSVLQPETIED